MPLFPHARFLSLALAAACLAGCSAARYRQQADRDVYSLLAQKELKLFGHTNAFTVDTSYSARDPFAVKAEEIIQDRFRSGKAFVTLPEALRLVVTNNRAYQLRKETLYLTGLTLTLDRHAFEKRPLGTLGGTVARDATDAVHATENASLSVAQLLQSGGTLSATLANDMVRYFTGDPSRSVTTVMSLNFTQPLLRGFGADVVAETLRQSERDVVYDLRGYALFQQTFAVDTVITYFRLLQRKDAVRNGYDNYLKLRKGREQSEALNQGERLSAYQVDQARQEELKAQIAYISAVELYQSGLDAFKQTLGLPVGFGLALDDGALKELEATGLIPVALTEEAGYEAAVARRMDLLNEIDRFEDAKRKITVTVNRLKPNLTFVASTSLGSDAVNYAKFDLRQYKASAGLQLDLPFDRLSERNLYRAALIGFERELRLLAIALDTARESVRQGLRSLTTVRQNYLIQQNALELANRRVDSANMLLTAGRAQVRDQLEAQTAQVQAQNAVTQALVDYHSARLRLLIDVGVLPATGDKFWLRPMGLPGAPATTNAVPVAGKILEVQPPEKIFSQP